MAWLETTLNCEEFRVTVSGPLRTVTIDPFFSTTSQLFPQLKQFRKESLKNSGLNGIRTPHGLCDAGAVLYQLSYQANWELVILRVRNIPVKDE